eukprot:TRINITY_DN33973_c0_g1_i1.p1 TRINITY_DN33973_c0_g1~~TRINITY_DN33973_c0_g1_i1.p1  ORF type:complete len:230 (+),score=27.09 TRINITY_DN33973_c0_g1_i1:12-701(+)
MIGEYTTPPVSPAGSPPCSPPPKEIYARCTTKSADPVKQGQGRFLDEYEDATRIAKRLYTARNKSDGKTYLIHDVRDNSATLSFLSNSSSVHIPTYYTCWKEEGRLFIVTGCEVKTAHAMPITEQEVSLFLKSVSLALQQAELLNISTTLNISDVLPLSNGAGYQVLSWSSALFSGRTDLRHLARSLLDVLNEVGCRTSLKALLEDLQHGEITYTFAEIADLCDTFLNL